MIGRRLQVVMREDDAGNLVKGIPLDEMRPGDYVGPVVGFTGSLPAVFFYKPNARDADAPSSARSLQHVCSPPHTFIENADGTLTITPSISDLRHGAVGNSDAWHGYLTDGVWVQV